MSRKSSLKKKLAVALSVVNALNSVAPMAIPYVNMTKNVSTKGGQEYGTGRGDVPIWGNVAYAADVAELPDGTTSVQTVNSGETGSVGTMKVGGKQTVNSGGTLVMNGGIYAGDLKGYGQCH